MLKHTTSIRVRYADTDKMQFIYNGITLENEPGLIITFEEFPQQYYHDAATFGWDFVELEKQGMLKIIMTSCFIK